MKKPRKLKFFNKVLEFQLKNKPDNQKLLILSDRLMGELEKQGYDTFGNGTIRAFTVFNHLTCVHISPSGESENIRIERNGEQLCN